MNRQWYTLLAPLMLAGLVVLSVACEEGEGDMGVGGLGGERQEREARGSAPDRDGLRQGEQARPRGEGEGEREQRATATPTQPPGRRVAVRAILNAPQQYLGERVMVDGEITRVLSQRAFILDDRIVVLSAVAPDRTLVEGARVQATGEVVRFRIEDFEAAARVPLPTAALAQLSSFGNQPAIQADSLTVR